MRTIFDKFVWLDNWYCHYGGTGVLFVVAVLILAVLVAISR